MGDPDGGAEPSAAPDAGGGVGSAAVIGALAGLLTVAAYEGVTRLIDRGPAPAAAVSASVSPSATASFRPSPLTVELSLLDEARGALRSGDPAQALAILDAYRREFPSGKMAADEAALRTEVEAALAGAVKAKP
jgi:hypothetical protein